MKRSFVAGAIAAGVLAALVVTQTDLLARLWQRYADVRLSAAEMQDDFWFYYLRFLLFYPTLWTLVGILGVFAVVYRPRLGWLAVSIFSVSFLLMSFAGNKATRYLSFAPPFLTIVWGLGLAYVLPLLWRYVEETRNQLMDTFALPRPLKSTVATAAIVVAGLMVFLTNAFWLRTATLIGDVALPGETPVTNWRAARDALMPWTEDSDIMITTEELGALYFLGRSDVRFSPSKLEELDRDQRHEFGLDYRTGLPVIATPNSVQRLVECFDRGIIVGPIAHWGDPVRISDDVQAILRRYAEPIEVPAESHLYAWGWMRDSSEPNPGYCAELSRFSHAGEIR